MIGEHIKGIIFDLGGVIIDVDKSRTVEAFQEYVGDDVESVYSVDQQDELFDELELGNIPYEVFRMEIMHKFGNQLTEEQFDDCWLAMLGVVPEARLEKLKHLSKAYPLFLLSNTNEKHMADIYDMLGRLYPSELLFPYFTQEYYSHFTGKRKPDPTTYDLVLKEQGLNPETTLFVDDDIKNIESAKQIGLQVHHLLPGEDISELF